MAKQKLQQHQLLAFIADNQTQFNNVRKESLKVITNGANFVEEKSTYSAFDPEDKDHPGDTSKEMITTVNERLKYDTKFLKKILNITGQKELTNTLAKANIVIYDDVTEEKTIICENVPVTLLIEYEKRAKEQLEFYKRLSTVDMNIKWTPGMNNAGVDCFVAPDREKVRNVQQQEETSFDPNPPGAKENNKFPMTPRVINKKVPVGKYITSVKDGRITPKVKAELMQRAEALVSAIKIARAKANETEVQSCNFGKQITDYLNG